MMQVVIQMYHGNEIAYLRNVLFRALEDGASLGALLGKINSKSDIPAALEIYETIRKERIVKIREETFRHQEEFHLLDGELQESRDKQLAMSFDAQDGNGLW